MAHQYSDPVGETRLRERDETIRKEEKGHLENPNPEYDDPFGSEEFAEVKYRTLTWWYEKIYSSSSP